MTMDLLVVDDQPGIRLLLTDILTGEGFTVVTASNGQDAVRLLEEREFSLILLDYRLPGMDGSGVLKRIQEMNLNTPAIVMSGLVETIEKEMEVFPQVKQILAKPFNIKDIPVIVRNALKLPQ